MTKKCKKTKALDSTHLKFDLFCLFLEQERAKNKEKKNKFKGERERKDEKKSGCIFRRIKIIVGS